MIQAQAISAAGCGGLVVISPYASGLRAAGGTQPRHDLHWVDRSRGREMLQPLIRRIHSATP